MAMTGSGTSPHVSGKLFRLLTGVDVAEVTYNGGGPALREMIAGKVDFMFEPVSAAIGPIRKGSLRALAVTTAQRSAALANLPTMAETVAGYEASAVTGIGAPRDTPPAVIATLNAAVRAGFQDSATRTRLADTGGELLSVSPAEFGKIFAQEIEKWARVVKASGMTPQ
jgi:tripartite-type tricarboxylate transporter receptor subunit TctC